MIGAAPLRPGNALSRFIRSPSAGAPGGPTLSAFLHPGNGACVLAPPSGGLRVNKGSQGEDGSDFAHDPVMVAEIVELLAGGPEGLVLDATVGGGGHAAALLAASPSLHLLGLDRDPAAVLAASTRLASFGARARIVKGRFDRLADVLRAGAPGQPVVGALFDLGVSSFQLDEPSRGFSYRFDSPLDMRMDPADRQSAADLVNEWAEQDLAALVADNGEARFSRRIARAIVVNRPISSTGELAEIVKAAIPAAARQRGGHPAKRVFQALRIAVNRELELLGPAVDDAIDALAPKGRCIVLSYHSGEDRIVKDRFVQAATGWCSCPEGLPCVCGAVPAVRLLNRGARMPTPEEIARNPRSSSARLRAVERLDSPLIRPRPPDESRRSTRRGPQPGTTRRKSYQRRGDGHPR